VASLIQRLHEVLSRRPEVLEAYLFGSCAAGRSQPHSDIDVAVYIDLERAGRPDYGYQASLTAALMSALATNEVDVVVLNQAPPLLYHRILRDGRRILARDLAGTTTREGQALSRYCDYAVQLSKLDAGRRPAHAK